MRKWLDCLAVFKFDIIMTTLRCKKYRTLLLMLLLFD